MKKALITILFVSAIPLNNAYGQFNTRRGSVLGGLAGAAAGAAIGEHNDEPLAGALIGGAIGVVTGAAVGNSRDRNIAESRAYQQQMQYQHQQQQYQQQQVMLRAVSAQDVVSMTEGGLSDSVIINHIRTNGVQRQLQVADVIALHRRGVSESVLTAMQSTQVGPQRSAPVQVVTPAPVPVRVYQPRPTVVFETYSTPRPSYPVRRQYRRPPVYHYDVHHHGSHSRHR